MGESQATKAANSIVSLGIPHPVCHSLMHLTMSSY